MTSTFDFVLLAVAMLAAILPLVAVRAIASRFR